MSGHFVSVFDYLPFMHRASHVEIRLFVILLGFEIASLCRLGQTYQTKVGIRYVLTRSYH